MASYPQQRRKEVELEVELDLLKFERIKLRVLLALTVLLCLSAIASSIICALHGWSWPAAGSGLSVAVLGGLTVKGISPPYPNPSAPPSKSLTTLVNPPPDEQGAAAGKWIEHGAPVTQKP